MRIRACVLTWPGQGAVRVVPNRLDTRVLEEVTAVGVLSASPGLDATVAAVAAGAGIHVDPRPR
jgi:hypothetical protein